MLSVDRAVSKMSVIELTEALDKTKKVSVEGWDEAEKNASAVRGRCI